MVELHRDPGDPTGVTVVINGVPSSHLDLADPSRLEFEYMQQMAAVIDRLGEPGEPLRVIHLGAAGCTLARYVQATRPGSRQLAVELDATCHAVDDDGALHAQIEALSNWHEARLDPKPRWSMAKVDPQARDRMMRAVRCFELRVAALRGTTKLSQNKSADDRAGVIAALGASDLAQAIARG